MLPISKQTSSTAWAFLVVSSEQQADSLPAQEQWAVQEAREKGWRLTRTFSDVATGKRGVRKLLVQVIAALRALPPEGRPTWIMMTRADRVGRGRIADSQVALHEIVDLGCRIWTRLEGEVKMDSASDQIFSALKAGLAAMENEVKSDKMRNVYKRKRENGEILANRRAYGLRPDTRTKDAPDGNLADAVRSAFEMRLAGKGYYTIAEVLHGVAPPRILKNGKPQYIVWSDSRVKRMLSNKAYVAGGVIDEVSFARVQRINENATTERVQPRYPWPLTGSLVCYCGRFIFGMACGARHSYRYYVCRFRFNHAHGKMQMTPAESVEAQFVELLQRLKAAPELIGEYRRRSVSLQPKDIAAEIARLRTQLAAITKKRDATWELHSSGKVRSEDVQERLDALAGQRTEIEAKIAAMQEQLAISTAANRRDRDVEDTIARAATEYERSDIEGKRAIARAVAIEVGGLCIEQDGTLTIRRRSRPSADRGSPKIGVTKCPAGFGGNIPPLA